MVDWYNRGMANVDAVERAVDGELIILKDDEFDDVWLLVIDDSISWLLMADDARPFRMANTWGRGGCSYDRIDDLVPLNPSEAAKTTFFFFAKSVVFLASAQRFDTNQQVPQI